MTPHDRASRAFPRNPELWPVLAECIREAQVAAIRHVVAEIALEADQNGMGRSAVEQSKAVRMFGMAAEPAPVKAKARLKGGI